MEEVATIVSDIQENDHLAIKSFVEENNIEWVIIGPEQPLIDGLTDVLEETNAKVFGPNKEAAQLEGSKEFAKKLWKSMIYQLQNIRQSQQKEEAINYVEQCKIPIVLKKMDLQLERCNRCFNT